MTPDKTENRDYNLPQENSTDWHIPLNENWEKIDADVQAALDMAQQALDAATGTETEEPTTGGTGFSWDQTHVDTSWLTEADSNDNLNVETVTSLDLTGPGSITEAVENGGDQPTVVVFEVGGVIDIGGGPYWRIQNPNTYIAGQTAPYPGISMIRGGPRVQALNVIVEHVGFYCGDDVNDPYKAGAITMDEPGNTLFNHCTAAWAPDTNIRVPQGGGPGAFINGINAEALNNSSHPEAPHGYAFNARFEGSWDLLGNLWSQNWKRNPRGPHDEINLVFANNYVWNWGRRLYHGSKDGGPEFDWISCVAEAGPDTVIEQGDRGGLFDNRTVDCFFDDVTFPSGMDREDANTTYVDAPQNLPSGLSLSDLKSASELESFLSPMVGPRPAHRAPHEQRMINDFVNRSGRIIDDHTDVGGYPDYDSNTRSLSLPTTDVLNWVQQYTDEVEQGS
ncbi:hypothetical protein EGH22_18850 [Halomicroarcula sp. F28]|uniref:hypothetical protein n=1 Tax=Haloarcula salinisoli TaxID=2487746 RepID=UPI001C72E1FA|nr:hypothetical protein [Halomicroarcula salinisoli]MBX0288393.1 hypothetical protein [Halomicroarcula salinisoli]